MYIILCLYYEEGCDDLNKKGFLNVNSEIGKLEAVMLHRPGKELERLTPEYLEELLFDDIPWLKRIREEHDDFANLMRDRGTEVYYYEKLLEEVLVNQEIKEEFIDDLVDIACLMGEDISNAIKEFLQSKSAKEVVDVAMTGLLKEEVELNVNKLGEKIEDEYPFYINPIPNLYFTRDPGAVIANGLSINKMKTPARDRETMFLEYIYNYNPLFKRENTPLWYDYKQKDSIEGGDILVLSSEVVAIGISERTSSGAVEILANRLFENSNVKKVLGIKIPFARAYMHLDTVFTMLDYDKFTIYPGIEKAVEVYELRKSGNNIIVDKKPSLKKALEDALKIKGIKLIQTGGGHKITAAREQWNDGTNTLAVAPGVIITYNRNEVSNEILRGHGIEVLEIEGSELVRGRGGPRCMSMPLVRKDID